MGLFIGGIIFGVLLGSFTYENRNDKSLFYGGIIVGLLCLLTLAFSVERGYLVFIGGTISWVALFYYENNTSKTEKKTKPPFNYQNHCWNCNSPINSQHNKRCEKCGWYICDNCVECGCNYPNK